MKLGPKLKARLLIYSLWSLRSTQIFLKIMRTRAQPMSVRGVYSIFRTPDRNPVEKSQLSRFLTNLKGLSSVSPFQRYLQMLKILLVGRFSHALQGDLFFQNHQEFHGLRTTLAE